MHMSMDKSRGGYHRMGRLGRGGSAYVEYFLTAGAILLAALAFYGGGNFQGLEGSVNGAFNRMVGAITQ